MGQQHADSDWLIREVRVAETEREVVVDVVIEPEKSLVVELHERGAGDGFGNGSDKVDGVYGCWFVLFDVVQAVAFLPYDRGVVDDTGGHAWVVTDFQ